MINFLIISFMIIFVMFWCDLGTGINEILKLLKYIERNTHK